MDKVRTLLKNYITLDRETMIMFCYPCGFGGVVRQNNDGTYNLRFGASDGSPEFLVDNLDDNKIMQTLTQLMQVYDALQTLIDDVKPKVVYW